MPTYEYACTSCDEHLEVVQSFRDDPLTTCPSCGSPLRKVFGSIGVVFKGSGFYKNDSRPAAKESTSSKEPKTAAASDSSGGATAKDKKASSDSSAGTKSGDSGSSSKTPKPEKSGSSSEKSGSSAAAS